MNSLDQAAPQIIKLHDEATKHAKLSVAAALRCGVLLSQARQDCPHGEWENYCVKTLGMSPVTAWRYIKLATSFQERGLSRPLARYEMCSSACRTYSNGRFATLSRSL